VKQAFLKAGLSVEDALLQARLARILRHTDWDVRQQQVRLWEPVNE
jgi:DNA polymerase-1